MKERTTSEFESFFVQTRLRRHRIFSGPSCCLWRLQTTRNRYLFRWERQREMKEEYESWLVCVIMIAILSWRWEKETLEEEQDSTYPSLFQEIGVIFSWGPLDSFRGVLLSSRVLLEVLCVYTKRDTVVSWGWFSRAFLCEGQNKKSTEGKRLGNGDSIPCN